MRFIDLTGQRFNRLRVVERVLDPDRPKRTTWRCECDCGTHVLADSWRLRKGLTQSCGCFGQEQRQAGIPRRVHGQYRTKEHTAWNNMRSRCNDPRNPKYPLYGGRGIRVCVAWRQSFEAFLADIGPAPSPQHSIDRVDVNGHYEAGNVRWATAVEQQNNRRNTKKP